RGGRFQVAALCEMDAIDAAIEQGADRDSVMPPTRLGAAPAPLASEPGLSREEITDRLLMRVTMETMQMSLIARRRPQSLGRVLSPLIDAVAERIRSQAAPLPTCPADTPRSPPPSFPPGSNRT